MTQQYTGGVAGDFIVHMESPQKCLTYGHVTAPAAGGDHAIAKSKITAYPLLANNVLAKAGDEANIVAFLIAGEAISALGDGESTSGVPYYTILSKFDGVVLNEDMLPTTDCAASPGTFNKTNIKSATGLADVKWVDEADYQEEQTT